MMLGSGGASNTFLDEIFKTALWTGNSASTHNIDNGMDLASLGGMTWIKRRDGTERNHVVDSGRGVTYGFWTELENQEYNYNDGSAVHSYLSNGYRLGDSQYVNNNSNTYVGWSWAKKEGWFDVQTWSGDGSNPRTINHNLGCVPGMVIIKRRNATTHWYVYHRATHTSNAAGHRMYLNQDSGRNDGKFPSAPTATTITVDSHSEVNASGGTYVAYLFAGGYYPPGSNTTSVRFTGGAHLTLASHSDLGMGTGDFTLEAWVYSNDWGGYEAIFDQDADGMTLAMSGASLRFKKATNSTNYLGASRPPKNAWTHIAVARESGTVRLFYNGVIQDEASCTYNFPAKNSRIGKETNGSLGGQISNFRIVKGTALYTDDFAVPGGPLTNVSGTVLLCCNDSSSVTGSTITPSTLTEAGGTLSIYGTLGYNQTPFTDTSGNVFGADGDKELIKHGNYRGNGSTDGPEIIIGWEPQYIMIKRVNESTNSDWVFVDTWRRISNREEGVGGTEADLRSDSAGGEGSNDFLCTTAKGFYLISTDGRVNDNEDEYLYTAIRRPDLLVSSEISGASNMFAIDTGSGSSTIPNFDAGFPVDFALTKDTDNAGGDWNVSARLMPLTQLRTEAADDESTQAANTFDSLTGWASESTWGSDYISYMWRRSQGLDVNVYLGNGDSGRRVHHQLNAVPEMVWIKCKDDNSTDWIVYHKGLNGGTNPHTHYIVLNSDAEEVDSTNAWNDTAPTSTAIYVGGWANVNEDNKNYLCVAFRSVDGVSKCGSYTGDGTTNGSKEITLGFEPKLLIIKGIDNGTHHWDVYDTTRGFGAGVACNYMRLNSTVDSTNLGNGLIEKSSTSFTVGCNGTSAYNSNGREHIYYAHA